MNLKNPKDMKKILMIIGGVFVVLLIVLIVVLATRSDDGVRTPRTGGRGDGQVEIEYQGLWELDSVMASIIDEYESNNPGVRILYSQASFGPDYESRLHTRLTQSITDGDPVADIVEINNTWLPKFEELLAPMPESVMSRQEYSETFYPACTEDFTGFDGQIYSIPIGIDGLALFYNKELLEQEGVSQPPEDWDGVTELAKQLTKTDNTGKITQAGLAMGTINNVSHSADIFSFLLLQNNVEVATVQNGFLNVDLSSREAASALTFYRSFANRHETWSSDLPLDLDMFFRGELAMFFAPSWRVFDIIEAAPAIEFDVVAAPRLMANEPVFYGMYWGKSVSASSPHQQEAWEFLRYLTQPEQLQKLYANSSNIRAFGQPYPRVDLRSEIENARYVQAIMQMAPDFKAWKMSQNPQVEEYINSGITQNDLESAENNINEFLNSL